VRVTTNEPDRTDKVDDVPKLLVGRPNLRRMLDMSDRTFRRKYSAGLIPRPIKISGSARWSVDEIRQWCAAGCPSRQVWEARKIQG
jgi:predicted DNA-binding transcriptional regulator AlpA